MPDSSSLRTLPDTFTTVDTQVVAPSQPRKFLLSRELGFVYDKSVSPPPLVYPMFIDLTPEGTFLIVDRRCPTNVVREIDHRGQIVWEYGGVARVGSAQRLEGGLTLLLDRRANAFVLVDRQGNTVSQRPLPNPIPPDTAVMLKNRVAITAGDDGLKWLNEKGKIIRAIAPIPNLLVEPRDIQVTSEGHILVTDIDLCHVVEMNLEGRALWKYGTPHRMQGEDRLYSPNSACRTSDGHTIIADTRAHRLLDIAPDGKLARAIEPRQIGSSFGNELIAPSFVRELPNGNLIAADTGNRRIVELTREGKEVWSYGHSGIIRRLFSFPRMAHPLSGGGALVCDSYNNRIVEVDGTGKVTWVFGGRDATYDCGLRIPRAARRLPNSNVLIADGVNHRILEVDRQGRITREIESFQHKGEVIRFLDPHDIMAQGPWIVVVDADLGQVIYLDEEGVARRVWPGEDGCDQYIDPHQVYFDGSEMLLADSGNNRVVRINAQGRCIWSTDFVKFPQAEGHSQLRYPRGVAADSDEVIIVDTENVRVLGVDVDSLVRWSYGPILEAAPSIDFPFFPEIRAMKRMEVVRPGHHLLTDFLNNRIITLSDRISLGFDYNSR